MTDHKCAVVSNHQLNEAYWVIEMEAPEIAGEVRPGQFVHLRIPNMGPSSLRRPFSVFGAEKGILKILYKIVGRGTNEMSRLQPGAELLAMGPLGRGFPLNPTGLPILVAGGYGVAPVSFLASRLPRKGVVLVGGRSCGDILALDIFEKIGWPVKVATEDGSMECRGRVTELLDRTLGECAEAGSLATAEIFACGPDGMLRAVGERAIAAGVRCWLSLDKRMVCGVGACLTCVQQLRRESGEIWIGRACHDGPVFEAREIVWEGNGES